MSGASPGPSERQPSAATERPTAGRAASWSYSQKGFFFFLIFKIRSLVSFCPLTQINNCIPGMTYKCKIKPFKKKKKKQQLHFGHMVLLFSVNSAAVKSFSLDVHFKLTSVSCTCSGENSTT